MPLYCPKGAEALSRVGIALQKCAVHEYIFEFAAGIVLNSAEISCPPALRNIDRKLRIW